MNSDTTHNTGSEQCRLACSETDRCRHHISELIFFFFNDRAPTEISPFPLHDALPIFDPFAKRAHVPQHLAAVSKQLLASGGQEEDRKSTRLNSSHGYISYAVFCL